MKKLEDEIDDSESGEEVTLPQIDPLGRPRLYSIGPDGTVYLEKVTIRDFDKRYFGR